MRRTAVLALAIGLLAAVLVVRFRSTPDAPAPARFAALDLAAFAAGGTLTDAWADVDGDGDLDRFVGFDGAPSRLYRNDGEEGFLDVAAASGLTVERRVRTSAWGDFDADGEPDLLLGYAGDPPVTALWRNDGGRFTEVGAEVGLALDSGATRQASWIDLDADGDLDLFLALRDRPNRMWRNDGDAFVDVSAVTGLDDPRRSVGAVWLDLEPDGDLDLYVANMDGDANGLWVNDEGVFADSAAAWGLADGGRAAGDASQGTVRPCAVDFDRDGDLDMSTANYGPHGLFRNPGGPGRWENVAAAHGLAIDGRYDTCAWADVDHDGWLDLYVNGTVTGGESHRDWLFGSGGDRFVDVTPPELLVEADHGATWVDYDRDGDLDLALAGAQAGGSHPLMRNLLMPEYAGHSLSVRVLDGRGRATRQGALVRVYGAGTPDLVGTGLVDSGSSYDGQSDLPVHVAVPGGGLVDVEVLWPAAGTMLRAWVARVDPARHRGGALEVRVAGPESRGGS